MGERRTPEDFAAEVEAHLALEVDRLIADGSTPEAARAAAHRRFGNATRVREDFYESTRWMWLERAWIDLRGAVRSVARYPAAALVAIVSLGGGIGGATVTLALRDTLHYLPPPLYGQPEALSIVRLDRPDATGALTPVRLYELWAQRSGEVGDLAGSADGQPADVRVGDRTETALVRGISPGLFKVLGVAPALGQRFDERPDAQPGSPLVMLSHRVWQDLFGGRPEAVGETLWVNGVVHTVIGVVPEHFWFGDLAQPIWTVVDTAALSSDTTMHVVVRRRDGETTAVLQGRLDGIARAYVDAQPAGQRELRIQVGPMIGTPIGEWMGPMPGILLGLAVVFTLLIGCTNVAVLLIAQWTAREHELAIRASIGAAQGRLVRTLLAESVVIAALGGLLGIAVTLALRGAIVWNGGEFTAFNLSIRPAVFAIAALLTVGAGVLTGLAPALHEIRRCATNPLVGLRGADHVRQRWRHALVAFEIATAVGLLVVVGAVVSASQRATSADPGFDMAPLLTVRVVNRGGLDVERVVAHLATLPGVQRAAAATVVPTGPAAPRTRVASGPATGEGGLSVDTATIGPGFLATLGARLTAGREFAGGDHVGESRVVLVNEQLAATLWPGQPAVGRVLTVAGRPHDVVGVVSDYAPGPLRVPTPMIFLPLASEPATSMYFLLRVNGEPGRLRDLVRREVNALAPGNVVSRAFAMTEIAVLSGREMLATAVPLVPLVAVATLLAAAGIYGVLAFAVSRRGTELAVRIAVGATRLQVLWEVSWASLRVVAAGLAGGVAVTFALTRLAQGSGGVFDAPGWAAFVVPVTLVSLVGALAVWLPARRALRIDPARLLRATDA